MQPEAGRLKARKDSLEEILSHRAYTTESVKRFFTAIERMGIFDMVTLFTESEFNRTGNSNANVGTDHGWGSHHLVVGASVRGGTTYGTFPVHLLSGPDDAGDRGAK